MIGVRGGGARLLGIASIVLLAAGGWLAWGRVARTPGPAAPAASGPAPSPELAERTLDRIEALRGGDGGPARVELGGAEVSSVLRYALPGILPPGVADPDVRLEDGAVALSALVAVAAFPDLPALDDVVGILPDTVPVRIDGHLQRYGKEALAFFVSGIEAAGLPLPDRIVPRVLGALGRQPRKGLPANALHIPMPSGLDSVLVVGDSLVLVATR